MKIVLDFDDTIFNTHQLVQDFLAIFRSLKFREEQFWNAYAECGKKIGGFDEKVLINLLAELKPFDKDKVGMKIDSIISKSKDFVYPDFFDFVKNFNKDDLILLSFGIADFQKIKIKNSGVTSNFKKVIITDKDKIVGLRSILKESKLNNDKKKDEKEKIFFVEDKADQINRVKEELPQIITLEMKRLRGGYINTVSKLTDYVVKDFYEARDIILGYPKD